MANLNQIPQIVKDFRVYRGGSVLLGVANVQLPTLTPLMDTIKGGGIAGELEVPIEGFMGPMALSLAFRSFTREGLGSLLTPTLQEILITGAQQVLDGATGRTVDEIVKVTARGFNKGAGNGKLEQGAQADGSVELSLSYYKVYLGTYKACEIDVLNYKCEIDGVDYLADLRSAL